MRSRAFLCVILLCSLVLVVSPAAVQSQGSGTIKYGKTVTGTIDDTTPSVTYKFSGKKGEIVGAQITTTSKAIATQRAGNSPEALDSHVVIVGSDNKEMANTLPSTAKGTFMSSSGGVVFALLPADGDYSVVARRSPDSHLAGTFSLILNTVPFMKSGAAVSGKIVAKELVAPRKYGALYAVQSDKDFNLNYRIKGQFPASLMVNKIAGKDPKNMLSSSGRLAALVGIVGPRTTFGKGDTSAYRGGSLIISGSKDPYVISIANSLSDYDSTFFLKGNDLEASCEYEVTVSPS